MAGGCYTSNSLGPLAQSVEQRTFNPWVVGSSPTGPTAFLSKSTNQPKIPLMPFPISTTRLSISPLELGDLEVFVGYRQDPQVSRFQSWDIDFSKEQALELIQSQAGVEFPALGDWLQLGIKEISTGKLLGDLALHALEQQHRYEIGFTLDTAHQSKGFAKEAAAKLLEFLFNEKHALSVEASTDRRNIASINLLKSLGFTEVPSRSWDEEFKGETVTVDVFELHRTEVLN